MSKKAKTILSWVVYFVGLIIYLICMNTLDDMFGITAWLLGMGCALGALMFAISPFIRK